MPRGVTDQFLHILDLERRHAIRALVAGGVLALLGLFLAELADEPLYGWASRFFTVALVAGAVLGVLLARRRTAAWSESLRARWSAWMRFSVSSTSVAEVDRKARGKAPLPAAAWGLVAGAALVANVALFAALWWEVAAAAAFGLALSAANGAGLGLWLGSRIFTFRWTSSVDRAVRELIRDGEVGLWGEA